MTQIRFHDNDNDVNIFMYNRAILYLSQFYLQLFLLQNLLFTCFAHLTIFYLCDKLLMWCFCCLQFLNVLVLSINVGCYQMMRYISRPTYSDNTQLVDPGLDLNMEGGMGE